MSYIFTDVLIIFLSPAVSSSFIYLSTNLRYFIYFY